MLLVAVFLAGAAGALARYLVDGAIAERWSGAFPMGTFVVNATGSLLLGLIVGYVTAHNAAPVNLKAIAGTGFVGAYSTFSTLTWETLTLLRGGARRYAAVNLGASLALGLGAAGLGLWVGGSL